MPLPKALPLFLLMFCLPSIAKNGVAQTASAASAGTAMSNADSGGAFVGGMNVKNVVLTKLTVKGDTRLWTFASRGLFGGSNDIGNDQKDRQGFTSEEVKPGVYKLTPAADLPAGQYAFKYVSFYFDFGVESQS